ncbi:MAG: twin-arginine translocase TatA/TatE family subunit [Candidatus Omnitrophica bacterium]|nr:twin-arginine translocase TatA/TatE family subunit [Candidatus Omnitrophota bacterium]
MFGLGLPEILLILLVILLVFGASRLPEVGRSLGKALSEFKKGFGGSQDEQDPKKPNG